MNLKIRAIVVCAVVAALAIVSWMAFRPHGEQSGRLKLTSLIFSERKSEETSPSD
jgi:hypothetical protein